MSENQTTEKVEVSNLAVIEPTPSTSVSLFGDGEAFEHAQRVAKMLSESELVPATFQKKIANCMIALEMSSRIGASPLMVMQNLYVVHGKPGWSSQFLIATLNASGRFTSLRYEEGAEDGGRTRAYAFDSKTNERCDGAWVTMKMAEAEGWVNKTGSKWKTMPELMRRYRAAAFFTRQFAPEVSMGISTVEEIKDMPYVDAEATIVESDPKKDRILKLIQNAKTLDELNKHRKAAGDVGLLDEFMGKETELEGK